MIPISKGKGATSHTCPPIPQFGHIVYRSYQPFCSPDITLYYTLSRKAFGFEEPVGDHVLYIAVSDHKERTTRIYTRDLDGGIDHFYSTKSDVPDINLEDGVVEVKFGEERCQGRQ